MHRRKTSLTNNSDINVDQLPRKITKKNSSISEYDKILFENRRVLAQYISKRDDELKEKQEIYNIKKDKIAIFKQRLNEIEENIKENNVEINKLTNSLLTHYHLLLTNGKDTRKEGLVWIIKAIWNLGYNVIISFMPNYLDEKGIKFLFKYAQIEIDAEKIRHEIDKVKFNVKLYYQANQFEVQTKMKKKESFGAKDNTRNLIKKAQEEILLDDNKFNYKLIKDMVLKDGSFDDKTKVYIQNLSELETKLNQKRDELYSLQQKELNRLNKEFLFNDYSRRYNIDQHSLIASIVGQDFAASEYSQRQREQRFIVR